MPLIPMLLTTSFIEWLKLGALETVLPIISRVTNRPIIGAPSCEDR